MEEMEVETKRPRQRCLGYVQTYSVVYDEKELTWGTLAITNCVSADVHAWVPQVS
jgi:hypothetical protein